MVEEIGVGAARDAGAHVLRFGPFAQRSLALIGTTDEGLMYLYGLLSWGGLFGETRERIREYLREPGRLERLKSARERGVKGPRPRPTSAAARVPREAGLNWGNS